MEKNVVGCIRSDRECADMYTFVLGFLSRQGSMKSDLLELSAITCEACAAECVEACRNHPLCV